MRWPEAVTFRLCLTSHDTCVRCATRTTCLALAAPQARESETKCALALSKGRTDPAPKAGKMEVYVQAGEGRLYIHFPNLATRRATFRSVSACANDASRRSRLDVARDVPARLPWSRDGQRHGHAPMDARRQAPLDCMPYKRMAYSGTAAGHGQAEKDVSNRRGILR